MLVFLLVYFERVVISSKFDADYHLKKLSQFFTIKNNNLSCYFLLSKHNHLDNKTNILKDNHFINLLSISGLGLYTNNL